MRAIFAMLDVSSYSHLSPIGLRRLVMGPYIIISKIKFTKNNKIIIISFSKIVISVGDEYRCGCTWGGGCHCLHTVHRWKYLRGFIPEGVRTQC